jgi:hypothetical protein
MADIRYGFPVVFYLVPGGKVPSKQDLMLLDSIHPNQLRLENTRNDHGKVTMTFIPSDELIESFNKRYETPSRKEYTAYFQTLLLSLLPQFKKPSGVLVFQKVSVTFNQDDNGELPSEKYLEMFRAFAGLYMILDEDYEEQDDCTILVGELTPYAVNRFAEEKVKGWGAACKYLEYKFNNFNQDSWFNDDVPVPIYAGKTTVQVIMEQS